MTVKTQNEQKKRAENRKGEKLQKREKNFAPSIVICIRISVDVLA